MATSIPLHNAVLLCHIFKLFSSLNFSEFGNSFFVGADFPSVRGLRTNVLWKYTILAGRAKKTLTGSAGRGITFPSSALT